MGENATSLPNTSLQGKKMAYRKVNADQRTQGHAQYLDNDDLQATTLELEWDMEKELEEPGFDHFQLDGTVDHHSGNSQNTNIDLEPIQPSASPKGRFQRLQEDPDYVSHYTRPAPKSKRCNFCRIFKLFCTVLILFIFGILIGYYAHKKCPPSPTPSEPSDPHFYHDILKEIKAENIQKIFRDLIQLPRKEEDTDIAMKLLVQWTSCGLEDVQLVNYSVLLDLPGSSSNTVTLKNSGECFYPSGQKCYRETKKLHSQDLLYSYAAYSAKGTLEAEVIDVQYGTVEDLVLIQAMTNVTNKIALLKLGQSPLLYKLSLLEEVGFGGVLLYVDPCDLPKTQNLSDKAFMVSLNNGGDPSTPGYPSIDGNYRQNRSNLTSLLVQPISALLVKRLVSLPEDRSKSDGCIPLKLAMTEKRIISLNVQTVPTYKTISNVIGYLKGSTFPDRYVIVGSHHNSVYGYSGQEWASSTAVITAFIQALMRKVKRGWRPDRTIVFCSWGGTSFGNIGSYEWAEDLKKVLQRNVVAYVSLHNPVRGNSSLHPVASPSLQQLATERQSLTCLGKMKCPGSNVSSVQMQGDSDYFINHLGVPTVQFSYEDIKTESPSFLFEALFPAHNTVTEELDPLFNLHETIAKLTGEVTLQIASEPVLPFNALDIALEVQNSLKGDQLDTRQLLAMASRLRDSAELFQSDEMRPANDPKERAPIRVRMLNDVLQGLEKNFLVQQAPPGFYRNILYRLDEKMSQFSVLLEALEHCKLHQSNETLQAALSKVLNSINSAQVYFKTGLDVFETAFAGKK
ncbi:inactive N-acetylated-alpha-linked acidic dipeptidase-like protein 2 isoform X1 [Malaclemys terrapin pileata]|uniref:inactive N-acetylated-alpha-linked acidic dipeptidase-like protein 2 isoform X1 n=2 Tax=Malaclemys terrapin pileata TaxID=2991368 RepID=UPI0023A850B6|nr:inactive N-acetylated-alpha-linked acidic dipeptidase-like protein 2 isoform X1 [Malaclemys terrapin pileata]